MTFLLQFFSLSSDAFSYSAVLELVEMAIGNSEVEAMEENTEAESSNGKEAQLASDLSKNFDLVEDGKEDNQEEDGIKGKSSNY